MREPSGRSGVRFRNVVAGAAAALIALSAAAHAQSDNRATVGGDTFVAGERARLAEPAGRDAFLAGFRVESAEAVTGDAHMAGFNVESSAPVGGDLYAAGMFVEVDAPVGDDVTATGYSVTIRSGAGIGGNARLSGRRISVDAPVAGALSAAAETLELDAGVDGDVIFAGRKIEFGRDARISGTLTYHAPERIDIPESVVAADRVVYREFDLPRPPRDFGRIAERVGHGIWPSFLSLFAGFVLSIAFLSVIAALALAFAPDAVERMRRAATGRPLVAALAGFLGLAMLFGLMPASAMTLIGIPFVPIVILAIVAAWAVGYVLGAYAVSHRLFSAFGATPATFAARLGVAVAGLVVMAALNFVPFLGWLANLAVLFLGLGALLAALFGRFGAAAAGEAT